MRAELAPAPPAGRPVRRSARDRDAGVAAVLVLALSAVLALVGSVTVTLAAVAVARQRAASVADLAALAAAQASLRGPAEACAQAARVAMLSDASLRSCSLEGDVAVVVAEVRPPGVLGGLGSASARARAGP